MIDAFYVELFSDPQFVEQFSAWCSVWRVLAVCGWLYALLFGRQWWHG
jgi:hypothetical protein